MHLPAANKIRRLSSLVGFDCLRRRGRVMADNNTERARFNMIEQQIRPWEVLDRRVLDTMLEIPREAYVPDAYRGLAFADIEIPISHGEHMMAPKIEARMLQALAIKPTDQALEVGTGSGFVTACLARLGARVTSVDIHADLIDQARERLEGENVTNVELHIQDALAGPLPNAPFDVIAVTGSLPLRENAQEFEQQLTTGGRLFVVTGESPVMEALLITRIGENEFRVESLFETDIAGLANAPAPEHFTF